MKYIIELNIVKGDPWIIRCNSSQEVKDYFERNPEHFMKNTVVYKQIKKSDISD